MSSTESMGEIDRIKHNFKLENKVFVNIILQKKGLKGKVVNRACQSENEGYLKELSVKDSPGLL